MHELKKFEWYVSAKRLNANSDNLPHHGDQDLHLCVTEIFGKPAAKMISGRKRNHEQEAKNSAMYPL